MLQTKQTALGSQMFGDLLKHHPFCPRILQASVSIAVQRRGLCTDCMCVCLNLSGQVQAELRTCKEQILALTQKVSSDGLEFLQGTSQYTVVCVCVHTP